MVTSVSDVRTTASLPASALASSTVFTSAQSPPAVVMLEMIVLAVVASNCVPLAAETHVPPDNVTIIVSPPATTVDSDALSNVPETVTANNA